MKIESCPVCDNYKFYIIDETGEIVCDDCETTYAFVVNKRALTPNKMTEESFDEALKYRFNDDCPFDAENIEPWEEPCSEICEKKETTCWQCWKKYFLNN